MKTNTTTQYARCLFEMMRESKKEEIVSRIDSFLKVVREDRMMGQIRMIISRFCDIWNDENKAVDAHITSRHPLSNEVKEKIITYIKRRYGDWDVTIYEDLDPSCIGGVRISVRGEVTDETIATRISRLRENLT